MKYQINNSVFRFLGIAGLAIVFGGALCAVPHVARAEGVNANAASDPFEMNTNVWKSFDRYKEEQRDKLLNAATGDLEKDMKSVEEAEKAQAEADAVQAAANAATAEADAKAQSSQQHMLADGKPVIAPPVLAQPDRPINTPALPALTSRFNVNIDSTDDDQKPEAEASSTRPKQVDPDPEVQTAKRDWLNPLQALQQTDTGDYGDDIAHMPINIRLSILPSYKAPHRKIPVPPKQLASVIEPPAPPPPAPAATPVNVAECNAVQDYKKRQLEAIQSDRETLVALKAAISELGLNKDLGFLTDSSSKMNIPSDTASVEASTAAAP